MKYLLLIGLLLLAACSTGPDTTPAGGGDFASEDTAADAKDIPPPRENPDKPLSDDERRNAATLIDKLAKAKEPGERETALQALIALGPRYLKVFRDVKDEDISLDMMWVIRRIENDARISRPEMPKREDPAPAPESTGGAGESRKPPPEYTGSEADFDREQVERFMTSRLNEARRHISAGNIDAATRIAEAALTLLPDSRSKPEFEKLLRDARLQAQAELLIAGTMQLAPSYLQYTTRAKAAKFAEPLKVTCFLKNVSAREIRLKLYGGPGRESLLQLDLTFEQFDYAGVAAKTLQAQSSVPVNAGAEAVLKPNETHSVEIPLEALNSLDSDAPMAWVLGKITIRAALRAYEAADADGRIIVLQPIRFPESSVLVLPAGFDAAAAARNPINTVRQHLKDNLPQEAFMAAQLVKDNQKRAMGDLLLGDDLDTDKLANQTARRRAMALLFGTGAAWDAAKWRRWWDQNRARF